MSRVPESIAARFRARLYATGASGPVVVALSGGLDSCALLHLARFRARQAGHEWIAAHFDHGMRASSRDDAEWVSGLCRAWDVPVHVARAERAPTSEEEAREARYAFLEEVRARTGASLVLTAHHADDQAETVLFRLLRGSGSKGLRGIPTHRGPSIVRPLLDVWRAELLDYAERARLTWREDPTNRSEAFARNALRNRILPDVERLVAPGARRALVRLADLSRADEAAWASVLPTLMGPLEVREGASGLSFDRAALAALHPAVRARVIRALAERLDVSLDHAVTRIAADFAATGASGRAIDLGGALTFGIDLDRAVLGSASPAGEERVLTIEDAGPGNGAVVLAGTAIPVAWGGDAPCRRRRTERFPVETLRFPLVVRSRRPGDRIRLSGGTRKVKKILLEGRIPLSERHRVPLVVDAEGQVIWIPGVARAESTARGDAYAELAIGIG
jgi:tRNA(Ile)-lysidine synthase